MVDPVRDLPPLRDVIAQYNLRAKKSLGQNFLLDMNLTSKIARQAGDLAHFDILEIGPGPGGLTRALLAAGARRVVAIERDERLRPALQDIADITKGRLEVVFGDATTVDPCDHLTAPIKIVANLPYNVGTALLVNWLEQDQWPPFWTSMTLMFQREVAERIVAKRGNKHYGRLALLTALRADASIKMDLPPSAFTPPPKVSSAVVHIEALPNYRFEADLSILKQITTQAFGQRRKMLRASLKGISKQIEKNLEAAGISPTARPEEVDLESFCKLSCVLKAHKKTN
ncbi:MAG: 16S rRNA (adenine(1518)-N(6)/adenine(1519)-N(6))-dimethyltransferase RsmA [Pseudomonadota bacterium]